VNCVISVSAFLDFGVDYIIYVSAFWSLRALMSADLISVPTTAHSRATATERGDACHPVLTSLPWEPTASTTGSWMGGADAYEAGRPLVSDKSSIPHPVALAIALHRGEASRGRWWNQFHCGIRIDFIVNSSLSLIF
jgi:hypothetical protein